MYQSLIADSGHTDSMLGVRNQLMNRIAKLPAFRALYYRDFRLLWLGAFLSFTGSTIQNVAQQDLVLEMTNSRGQLAMVSFAMMVPVSIFGPILGVAADMYDKRKLLISCMLASAVGPLFLGIAQVGHFIHYWMFLVVAAASGLIQCIEVPTRQSIVRSVVSEQDLAAAIPAQASTFNLARIVGPSIAVFFLIRLGPEACFWINGLSFFALAYAAWTLKTNLEPLSARVEPIKDLVLEGIRYTFQDKRLRMLFLMESATAVFGTFYMSQMSALSKQHLGLSKAGLNVAFTSVGIGALLGLLLTASLSRKNIKGQLVLAAMACMSLSIVAMGIIRVPAISFLILAISGACTIIQFNTTNTLFQLMSPANLRGRVISMHMWAISGIAPLGVLVFGFISEWYGLSVALVAGGTILAGIAVWAVSNHKTLISDQ